MLLKHRYPPIDPTTPFEHDKLEREQFGKNVTKLVQTLDQPFVIAVDGPWGSGKTTFVQMWRASLNAERHPTFYFNAWEHDFADDPLLGLISEIDRQISSVAPTGAVEKVSKWWDATKNAAAAGIRIVGPLALRIATQGVLDGRAIGDAVTITKDVADATAEYVEDVAKAQLEAHAGAMRALDVFRDKLGGFAAAVSDPDSGKRRPAIVIVDELDRCRPTFAIALLERIKHFFSVNDLCFVLAVDRVQLSHSLRAVYGSGMDTDGYLRRFIDLTLRLPEPKRRTFAGHLYNEMKLGELIEIDRGTWLDNFSLFADLFELSLRVIEQCFTELSVIYRLFTPLWNDLIHIAAFLVVLRSARPDIYTAFVAGTLNGREVVKSLEEVPGGLVTVKTMRPSIAAALYALSRQADELESVLSQTRSLIQATDDARGRQRLEALAKSMEGAGEYNFRTLAALRDVLEFSGQVRI